MGFEASEKPSIAWWRRCRIILARHRKGLELGTTKIETFGDAILLFFGVRPISNEAKTDERF